MRKLSELLEGADETQRQNAAKEIGELRKHLKRTIMGLDLRDIADIESLIQYKFWNVGQHNEYRFKPEYADEVLRMGRVVDMCIRDIGRYKDTPERQLYQENLRGYLEMAHFWLSGINLQK